MYNHALDTFIRAAELGSFSKVAEENYISPSAVIQQINNLEKDLGVKLFFRNKKGVTLTPAGNYLLLESKALIQRNNDIRAHLSLFSETASGSVLFGSNHFHMPSLLYDYWPGFVSANTSSTLSSYSFNETGSDIRPDTDLIEGVLFSEPSWQKNFVFHELTKTALAILVPEGSDLANHKILTDIDLRNYTLLSIHNGVSEATDKLEAHFSSIGIAVEEVFMYSTSVLIESLGHGKPVIIPDCWKNFHPKSVMIPYIDEYTLPYGFFLSKNASPSSRKFLEYIKAHLD